MTLMHSRLIVAGTLVVILLVRATAVQAQPGATASERPWSAEFAIGWDNSISGNINSSGLGRLNNQAVVITKNRYEDVYGTGLQLRFGGGYMLNDNTEARATFAFQSLDADLTPMGEYGASRLYGQYSDYQSLTLDVGLRRYAASSSSVRVYGEGTIGLGFVDKTDVTLAAPAANLFQDANDFYDQTAAFAFGGNAGLLFDAGTRTGLFAQIGLRWVSGMSEIDDLAGTGLETINDKSARLTFPFLIGARFRF